MNKYGIKWLVQSCGNVPRSTVTFAGGQVVSRDGMDTMGLCKRMHFAWLPADL